MAQSASASSLSSLSKAASGFFAALKGGSATGDLSEGDGFSQLLSHLAETNKAAETADPSMETGPVQKNVENTQNQSAAPWKQGVRKNEADRGEQDTTGNAQQEKAAQESGTPRSEHIEVRDAANNTQDGIEAEAEDVPLNADSGVDEIQDKDCEDLASAVALLAQTLPQSRPEVKTTDAVGDTDQADEAGSTDALSALNELAMTEHDAYLLLQKMMARKAALQEEADPEGLAETGSMAQDATEASSQSYKDLLAAAAYEPSNDQNGQSQTQDQNGSVNASATTTLDAMHKTSPDRDAAADLAADLSGDAPEALSAQGQQGQSAASTGPASSSVVTAATAAATLAETGAAKGAVSGGSGTGNALAGVGGVRSSSSYDMASHLSADKNGRATSGSATTVVEQVAVQIRKSAAMGENEITLQLRPEELGRVDIKLTFGDDNSVTGTVVADSQATLDMLSKDVGGLQRALQDAGLRADGQSLQFSLRGDDSQNAFAQQQQRQNSGDSNDSRALASVSVVSDSETADLSSEVALGALSGRVNLRV